MCKLMPNIHTPELEPNLSFLPYVTAAYATCILLFLMCWGTGSIHPSEYGPGAKKHVATSEPAHH